MTTPAEHAARVKETATPWEEPLPQDAAVSATPELEGVTPETTTGVDGVDVESMPSLRELGRLMPSERAKLQATMIRVAKSLPEEWVNSDSDDVQNVILDKGLEGLDPDTFVNIFKSMEQIVFEVSADKDAMREWILDQDSPSDALTYAFSRVSEALGN